MKNLLFISIAFPPKLDPECIQTARYYKYMSTLGKQFNIQVVTSALPTLFMPGDESMKRYLSHQNKKIDLKLFEPRLIHALINKIAPALLQLPDSKYSFYKQWKYVVKSLHLKPDIIYSRSYPLSSAILAMKLQKHYKVPWILHLSDPWMESPLHKYGTFAGKINERWEKACFTTANYISFTSEKTISLYEKKYPALTNRYVYSPNVFDSEDINEKKHPNNSAKLKFVYTGGLANTRTATTLLQAIKKLREQNPEVLDNCEFLFAGDMDNRNKTLFTRFADKTIQHLGHLSYKEAAALQKSAHVLVAIDSPVVDSSNAIFFPSKLLDYWVAGSTILALTTPGSTTSELIHNYKLGKVLPTDNVSEVQMYIVECIENFNNHNTEFFRIMKPIKEYDAQYNAEKVLSLFDKVTE